MNENKFNAVRNGLFLAVMVFVVGHLAWEYFNGGVVTHHILARADLPGISNWWALVILPLLTLLSAVLVKKRIVDETVSESDPRALPKSVIFGFLGMLVVSIIQSVAFITGYSEVTKYLALGVFALALFLPLYRMECILGHVLGATFVFGPAIPFIGVVIFATLSLISHKGIKPLFKRFRGGEKAMS